MENKLFLFYFIYLFNVHVYLTRAWAIAMRCFCPPDSWIPPSPTIMFMCTWLEPELWRCAASVPQRAEFLPLPPWCSASWEASGWNPMHLPLYTPVKKENTGFRAHCTKNLKYIFLEMKLCGLVPNFHIHESVINYSHDRSYLESLLYFLYCVRELSAQPQKRREGQETAAKQWLTAVPCPILRSCGWAESLLIWPIYKFPICKIMGYKWKQLILVVNFLFGLRVNEIPNKTFILDSFAVQTRK